MKLVLFSLLVVGDALFFILYTPSRIYARCRQRWADAQALQLSEPNNE